MNSTHSSFLFSFAEKYTLLVLTTVGAMVLSRLLTPADIGVYSIGAVLVGLAQVVRDFGVGLYVIQEKDLTPDKLRAAFSTSLAVAWLLAALVFLLSAPVAQFYQEPRLRLVLRLLAVNFLLIPFSSVTLPYLRRQMRFSALLVINATNSLAQLVCSLWLAWRGYGYLSLVWAALAGTLAALLVSLRFRPAAMPWLPGWRGMGRILSFGALSTGGGVIDEAGVAAPDLIIGRLIGVAGVGLFSKALGALNVFNQLITSAISPVIFPLYSSHARSGGDLRRAYLTTVSYMTALAWPFFGFVALMAKPIVEVLYGDQWDAAVPLIRIMSLSSALYSMFSMARYLFVAMGEVKAQAQLDTLAVPVRIIAVLAAAPFGLPWVAWAVVLGAVFRSWLTFAYLARLTGLDLIDLLRAVRRSALLTMLSLAGPLLVNVALQLGRAHYLTCLLVAAAASALLWPAGVALFRHEVLAEWQLLRRKTLDMPVK